MGQVESLFTCLQLFCLGCLFVLSTLLRVAQGALRWIVNAVAYNVKFRKVHLDKFLKGIIAHRCGTPENTLDGIRWCKKCGAVAVEMDLRVTKDGIPVIYHDDDITRMTLDEANSSREGEGSSIPTIFQVLELCKELDLTIFLEVKAFIGFGPPKAREIIKKLYMEDQSLYDRMIVCSFSPLLLLLVRLMDQKIPVAIIHRRYPITTVMPRHVLKPLLPYIDGVILWCIHAWFVDLLGITLMLVHKDGLSWWYVEDWRRKNVNILAWTVNDKHEQAFCEKVLQIPFMTDHPTT
ncbi:glycerophosphodiester phosphodiesterase 1-like [Dysidea avara]|uniref:glycerophosphodiester phosphodiesterase 1-like n=1 Tax=Dysidea avara TaxID=196820 RepID=UPI0033168A68